MESKIEEVCYEFRKKCLELEKDIRALMSHSVFKSEQERIDQHSEMKANIMLTVRHLEDARMRAGKIVQASGSGVSILPK